MREIKLKANGDGELSLKVPWLMILTVLGSCIAAAVAVVFGVWVSNRDLGKSVESLDKTVNRLVPAVQSLEIGAKDIGFNQKRLDTLERRVEKLEDKKG